MKSPLLLLTEYLRLTV